MNMSSETDSFEPEKGFPIEVNVIVLNANGVQNVYPDIDNQEERKDSVINKYATTSGSENRKLGDSVIVDIENETQSDEKCTSNGNEFDSCLSTVDLCSAPLLSAKEGNILTEEGQAKKEDSSLQENDTLNRFLNDLYEKKLDLRNKYSDQEVKDVRAAVIEQVNLIVKRINGIDSRLKIQEVLLVGSAREETQIIRPCEYDFILTLEALSKPGAVSITPEDPEGNSREYMRVKLEDDDVRSVFHEFSDNGNIIATRLLPWNRQGLRDLFSTAVRQAVTLCSRSCVVTDTGKLKLKRRKPKTHGPACTISLLWERTTIEKHTTMEISVDLCSALKVDFENYYSLLPSSDTPTPRSSSQRTVDFDSHKLNHAKSNESVLPFTDNSVSNNSNHGHFTEPILPFSNSLVSNDRNHSPSTESVLPSSGNAVCNDLAYAKSIESVLLMPREGMRFKVAFTESELLLTSNLSEHHRKCYRLLKYIMNGEPFPLEGSRIRRFFKDSHTYINSYIIKRTVWDHHHVQQCDQETNLGICITKILSKLKVAKAEGLVHPFNKNRIIETSSKWRDELPTLSDLDMKAPKLDKLFPVIRKIKNTPVDAYDYKASFNALLSSHNLRAIFKNMFLTLPLVYVPLLMPLVLLDTISGGPSLISVTSIMIIGFSLYTLFYRRAIHNKWRIWAIPLSLCTKHIDAWVICTCMAILLVTGLLSTASLPLRLSFILVAVLYISLYVLRLILVKFRCYFSSTVFISNY